MASAMAQLHPAHGARIVLERVSVDDVRARYRVRVYEPDGVLHTTSAELEGGTAALQPWPTDPPAWARTFTERLLSSTAKKHASGTWPRKITRWREAR